MGAGNGAEAAKTHRGSCRGFCQGALPALRGLSPGLKAACVLCFAQLMSQLFQGAFEGERKALP